MTIEHTQCRHVGQGSPCLKVRRSRPILSPRWGLRQQCQAGRGEREKAYAQLQQQQRAQLTHRTLQPAQFLAHRGGHRRAVLLGTCGRRSTVPLRGLLQQDLRALLALLDPALGRAGHVASELFQQLALRIPTSFDQLLVQRRQDHHRIVTADGDAVPRSVAISPINASRSITERPMR